VTIARDRVDCQFDKWLYRTSKPPIIPRLRLPESPPAAPRSERRTYLDDWVTSPVYDFDALAPKQAIAGPAIIESPMTTVLLRQDETATVTPLGWLDFILPPMPRGR
jgi:N-methylhydantoinase A/oxoprolinase/acetone carboxylase beta subunit